MIIRKPGKPARIRDKARLRQLWDELLGVPLDEVNQGSVRERRQQALDFVAMAAGLRPVYPIGCGFGDPGWVAGARAAATARSYRIVTGPPFRHVAPGGDLPDWFVKIHEDNRIPQTVDYVCRSRDAVERVEAMIRAAVITPADEAWSTGYPKCCIAERHNSLREAVVRLYDLIRTSSDDPVEIARRYRELDVPEDAVTEEFVSEIVPLLGHPCLPLTSLAPCDTCATGQGPAARVVEAHVALALAVDRAWVEAVLDEMEDDLGELSLGRDAA